METLFQQTIRRLQEIEDRYSIIIKLDLFTDVTGSLQYLTDTEKVVWKTGFYFSGLESFKSLLDEFEEFLGS
jgi:hypothetical protein